MNAAVFSGTLTIVVSIVIVLALVILGVGVWRYIHSNSTRKD
ncbi:MAG: hypothetical protein SPI12_01510 [Actinomycetaceae bacterium]|nr:hypothetical protein [Actinomycetaceae bacterium]MDY6082524.1 hypothetical protein [Actinomycetaceae bacterium]